MFLNKLIENNKALFDYAFTASSSGLFLPDTYILDLDTIVDNGKKMVAEAKKYNLKLYFMLKQIGRNPLVAKKLMEVGFDGCVAVDYKEALLMVENNIPLSNVGHLEQVPCNALKKIISSKPELITVYTKEKIKEINEVASSLGLVANIMLRVTDKDAYIYSGQEMGIDPSDVESYIDLIESLDNVVLKGLTTFPALLYSASDNAIVATENIGSIEKVRPILEKRGYFDINYNLPSASCCASFKLISELGGNSAEPGHGLTGTTPLHKVTDQPEKVGYVYVSEVAHNFRGHGYCYGGGTYRRGHMENCAVGTSGNDYKLLKVSTPDDDSIDYHFQISEECNVSDTVVMCFRTQIFTTRSLVAVVEGLGKNEPVMHLYDSLGKEVKRNW